MQEARKDGCLSAVLELVLALGCPHAQSIQPAHGGLCLLSFSQAYLSSLKPNLLQRCNSIKAYNQYTRNCTLIYHFYKNKKIGKMFCDWVGGCVCVSACMYLYVKAPILQIRQSRAGQKCWLNHKCWHTKLHKRSPSTGWHCYEFLFPF